MAAPLLAEYAAGFAAIAAEHGELLLVDQVIELLLGGPPAAAPAASHRGHANPGLPVRLVIRGQLEALAAAHGGEHVLRSQARELLASYALSGARRAMARRKGQDGRCAACAEREALREHTDRVVARAAAARGSAAGGE